MKSEWDTFFAENLETASAADYELPDEVKTAIFTALGSASMCWDPIPSGVFDSTLASKIGHTLSKFIYLKAKTI